MFFLNKTKNKSGAYPGPMSSKFKNSYAITDEQVKFLVSYNGFVIVTETPDPDIEGSTVTLTVNADLWEQWKAQQPDPLEAIKTKRIANSKADLSAYLVSHPLQWTDGEYYSITAEKQAQLTSKIMAATMAQTLSSDYHLTWNSTGEVCKEWTLQDLASLAFAIDARVTALVTYQQTKEVEIRNATTQEELDAIEVNYDEVE